jgi:hypothetical protein
LPNILVPASKRGPKVNLRELNNPNRAVNKTGAASARKQPRHPPQRRPSHGVRCRARGIDPWEYLKHVFTRGPAATNKELLQFLSANWKEIRMSAA